MLACAGVGALLAATPAPAAERAFELVSPVHTDAHIGLGSWAPVSVSRDGDIACYHSPDNPTGDAPAGGLAASEGFCATRTADGWASKWMTGPWSPQDEVGNPMIRYVREDGRRVMFQSVRVLDGASFGYHVYVRDGDGPPSWASGPAGVPSDDRFRRLAGASRDLNTSFFVTSDRVLPAVDANDVDDVYQWRQGQGTRLVSADDAGQAVGAVVPTDNLNDVGQGHPGTVSADGTKAIFVTVAAIAGAPGGVDTVFQHRGDTVVAVPRRGPGGTTPEPMTFVGASDDGDTLFVATAEQLTDDAITPGGSVYRYHVPSDELQLIATGGARGLAVSADGSTLVYQAGLELRVFRNGASSVVGPVSSMDGALPFRVASPKVLQRALRMTPDGRTLVFVSQGAMAGSSGAQAQVFRWTVDGGVERISPEPLDGPPTQAATIGNFSSILPFYPGRVDMTAGGEPIVAGRVMSEDGRTVFFDSFDRLVPEDTNGRSDTYQWRDGQVSLISPGTADADSHYHDSSADGSTVFFTTPERILPDRDINGVQDLYAARVGGGFPPLPPSTDTPGGAPPAVGPGRAGGAPQSATQSTEPVAPVEQAPREPRPPAAGDASPKATIGVKGRSLRVRGRGRARLVVRLSAPGTITARGRLGRGRATSDEAGTVRLNLRLSRSTRRALARGERVRGRVVLRLETEDGARTRRSVRFTIRPSRAMRAAASRHAGKDQGARR